MFTETGQRLVRDPRNAEELRALINVEIVAKEQRADEKLDQIIDMLRDETIAKDSKCLQHVKPLMSRALEMLHGEMSGLLKEQQVGYSRLTAMLMVDTRRESIAIPPPQSQALLPRQLVRLPSDVGLVQVARVVLVAVCDCP